MNALQRLPGLPASLNESRWLARYAMLALLVAGGLEWLLGRTISRLGAAPVLTGPARDAVEFVGKVGLALVSPAFLLAIFLLGVAVWGRLREAQEKRSWELAALLFTLAIVGAFVLAHTFLPTDPRLNLSFNLLLCAAVWWLAARFALQARVDLAARVGVVLVGLAYTGWYAYVLMEIASPAGPGGSDAGVGALGVGELLVTLAPLAFFKAIARNGAARNTRRWIVATLVALLFSAGNVADTVFNQGFTAVFTTWSIGINLAWPWPLYAVSLALYLYAVLTCLSAGSKRSPYANADTGAGLLFLILAGYNLQTPYQHLLAVLSLLLLTGLLRPFSEPTALEQVSAEAHQDESPAFSRPPLSEQPHAYEPGQGRTSSS